MELTKAEVRRIRDALYDCTHHIKEYLNGDDEVLPNLYPCFSGIARKAEQANDYIVNNEDKDLALFLSSMDRGLWRRIQSCCDVPFVFDAYGSDDGKRLQREYSTVEKRLLEIHNWYLEVVCNISIEDIRNCNYFVDGNGNVRNSKTKEIIKQEDKPTASNNCILPKELNTDEALRYFAKAKEIGLIDDEYRWLKGKQLLACFCAEMSQKLKLGISDRIAWKPFEILFGIETGKLRSNYNDIQKTGQNPSDIALVEEVFE